MEHYYSRKQTSEESVKAVEAVFGDREFIFMTSSGVFSRNFVDFGSRLLIETVMNEDLPGSPRILDIGCGYGPVGIVLAASKGDSTVEMTDINERAVKLARENIELNDISNAKVSVSDSFGSINGKYDVIVTNPPIRAGKSIVYGFFEGAYGKLNEGGCFYCVIQKKQGADSAERKLSELFGNCSLIARKSGYRILKSCR